VQGGKKKLTMATLTIKSPVDCPRFTFDDLLQFLEFKIEREMRDAEECVQDQANEDAAQAHFARAAAFQEIEGFLKSKLPR